MADEGKILARVTNTNNDNLYPVNREDQQIEINSQAELLTVWSSAPYVEIVRQGRSYSVMNATTVASVIAMPTTACAIALYNNEPDLGRSYIIDSVWALFTANTAITQVHVGIIGLLGSVREALPATAAPVIKQLNGGGKLDTRARTIISGTALPATTGLAPNWFPIGNSMNTNIVTLPGFCQWVPIDGKIIVPPGRYFALHTLGSVTTTSAMCGVSWTEKQIALG